MRIGTRVMHELKRRSLVVRETYQVTPSMLRLVLEGPALQDFVSLAPDDHVKLIVPGPNGEPQRRDYTPRYFDRETGTLAVDFALHQTGAATDWARRAKPGDQVELAGPRGSMVVPWALDWWLLVGDEAALPAIARRIEEAPAGTRIDAVIAVAGPEDEQAFESQADVRVTWVHRAQSKAADAAPLMAALPAALPAGQGFVWIAAEGLVARALRDHVRDALGHPRDLMKSSGYWVQGKADAHVKFDD